MRRSFAPALLLTAAGCGGGASNPIAVSTAPAVAPATPASARSAVAFTVTIPSAVAKKAGSARTRRPDYVSPSTTGLIVTVTDTNGTASYGYTIGSSAPDCGMTAGGQTTCNLTLGAAAGNDTFSAYTYDMGQGASGNPTTLASGYTASGNLLSQVTGFSQTIQADSNNSVSLVLQAVVDTVTSANGPSVLSVSGNGGTTSGTTPALIDGLDADGNQIGYYVSSSKAGVYANPISVGVTDGGKGDTTVAPTMLGNATADGVTASFDGAQGDQPTSATATPYSASLAGSDSFTQGGYGGTTSYPQSASAGVTIAPLFLYAPTTSMQQNASSTLYALAAARPANASYSIAKTANSTSNNCDAFSTAAATPTSGTSQVAAFTITATSTSPTTNGNAVPCVFAVSDGTGTTTNSAAFTAYGTNVIIIVPSPRPSGS